MTTKPLQIDQSDSQFPPIHTFTTHLFKINSLLPYITTTKLDDVLTVVNIMVTELWDFTTCSLVDKHQHFTKAYCLHLECRRKDGGSMFLQNICARQ
jgi:hypothetical protein